VKRFYKKKNQIELISENPEFEPIVIERNYSSFNIVGIVVGVYRSMERKKAG
jgi:repressor LexA